MPDLSTTLWLFTAAFAASALGGVLGMASGIFIVPMLTLLFGVDIHGAIGASLISVIACSCGSAAAFLKERLTNVRLAIVLETATTIGALTGVFLIGMVSTAFLYGLFALILLVSARQMLALRKERVAAETADARSWSTALLLHGTFSDRVLGREVSYQVGNLPLGLGLMYGAGVISALLGLRRAENSRHGHGLAAADQGLVGYLQLHDRCDGGGQCGGVFRAWGHRHRRCRAGGAGFGGGGLARRAVADGPAGGPVAAVLCRGAGAAGSADGAERAGCQSAGRRCMKPQAPKGMERRDLWLAALLWFGTWLASGVIALGIGLDLLQRYAGMPAIGISGLTLVTAGVGLFILLSVARVLAMLLMFLRERDRVYAGIVALVLLIIAAGVWLGL